MQENLLISIYSFGFQKSGIPADPAGHGGGYVFDCRGLPNPGRESEFATFTGQDKNVIDFLESYENVNEFLGMAFRMVVKHAENYKQREFTNLFVAFGCTGGQHRSVYFAETLAARFRGRSQVLVRHREIKA